MDFIEAFQLERNEKIKNIKNNFKENYQLINDVFNVSHEICDYFILDDDYLRVIGLIFTKSILLAKSMFSIILEGYGQESGALLRYFVETIELIRYFREDDRRIDEFIENKLPSAGKIAQAIKGDFKELRQYLNKNACHFNVSSYSLSHVIDLKNNRLKPNQKITNRVLLTNLNVFCTFMYFLCYETIYAIYKRVNIPKELLRKIDNISRTIASIDNEE